MDKTTSNKDQKKQKPIAEESDLTKLRDIYKELEQVTENIRKKISEVDNPAKKRFLESNLQATEDMLAKTKENLDGLESVLYDDSPQNITEPQVEPVKFTPVKTEKIKTVTNYIDYIVTYFVENPGQEKLSVSDIAKATNGIAGTIRHYLNKGRLPLQIKKDSNRQVHIDNKTVELDGFIVPGAVLAAWKKFDTLEESELYLYTTHDKIKQLKKAVENYDGKLDLEFPELDPHQAFRYPYLRQLAKNNHLIDVFNKLLDSGNLGTEDSKKIKEFKGEQVLLHEWENAMTQDASPVMYFLTKYSDVPEDQRHMTKPIVKLLKERGLLLAEIIQILDKPVSRVLHAIELLSGADKTGCPYTLLDKTASCMKTPKIIGAYPLQEGRIDFRFMPLELKTAYIECLRYGVKPTPTDTKGHAKNFEVEVDGTKFQLHKDGVYEGSKKIAQAEFSTLLKKSYHNKIK